MASDRDSAKRMRAPGAKLRELRVERELTLSEVSSRTGLSVSTLSKIENGKMSLTYDKLASLSEGLGIEIAQLFGGGETGTEPQETARGRKSVTRLNEGGRIDAPTYDHTFHATDLLNKKFVPLVGVIKQRTMEEFGPFLRHEGDEYSYVLEGTVEFRSELYAPILLRTGESIYFDSSMGHAYLAVGDEPCKVLSICAGPGIREAELEASALANRQLAAAGASVVLLHEAPTAGKSGKSRSRAAVRQ